MAVDTTNRVPYPHQKDDFPDIPDMIWSERFINPGYIVLLNDRGEDSHAHSSSGMPCQIENPALQSGGKQSDLENYASWQSGGKQSVLESYASWKEPKLQHLSWGPSPPPPYTCVDPSKIAGDGGQGENDDDTYSICSSCPEKCPSECGETGQGIICYDDNCEALPTGDLSGGAACIDPCFDKACEHMCVDEACEGPIKACTDANCLRDGLAPAGTEEEAAAAAALTSFVGLGDMGPFSDGDQFYGFDNGFTFNTNQQLSNQHDQSTHGMDLASMDTPSMDTLSMDAARDAQFGMKPPTPASYVSGAGQYGQFMTPRSMEFVNHLAQFHCPLENHMRPCFADTPRFMGIRCPLPNPNYEHIDPGGFLPQNPDFQCGYSVEDADTFAHHLAAVHKPSFPDISMPDYNLSSDPWNRVEQQNHNNVQAYLDPSQGNQAQQPNRDNGEGYLDPSQGSYDQQDPNFQNSNANANTNSNTDDESLRQISTSDSSIGPSSVRTTPVTSPDTPLTSSIGSHPLSFHVRPFSFELPFQEQSIERRSTSPNQSLGPQNVYQCFWTDAETGVVCHQNFENSDQLDAHCKEHHTKTLEKAKGGFRCMWQSCKRGDGCFQTKAKLNRHLQTHTGFKPMQCRFCGMRLSAKQALDQHERTHTNDKPYHCQFGCGKRFKQHSALTMHHRTHTKEKPLKCETCGALFTESSNLSKHRRTHEVKGMFHCELCGKDFHRLDQLRRHLASSHKDRPEDANRAIERAKSWNKRAQNSKHRQRASISMFSVSPLPADLPRTGSEDDLHGLPVRPIKIEP